MDVGTKGIQGEQARKGRNEGATPLLLALTCGCCLCLTLAVELPILLCKFVTRISPHLWIDIRFCTWMPLHTKLSYSQIAVTRVELFYGAH